MPNQSDKYWLMLSNIKSDNENFHFVHPTTSSIIRLIQYGRDKTTIEKEIWMDYYEWEEFCNFIKTLSSEYTEICNG